MRKSHDKPEDIILWAGLSLNAVTGHASLDHLRLLNHIRVSSLLI